MESWKLKNFSKREKATRSGDLEGFGKEESMLTKKNSRMRERKSCDFEDWKETVNAGRNLSLKI